MYSEMSHPMFLGSGAPRDWCSLVTFAAGVRLLANFGSNYPRPPFLRMSSSLLCLPTVWCLGASSLVCNQAVISLENTQIHRYALKPAGTFIFRCWSLFSDGLYWLFPVFLQFCWCADTQIRRYADRCSCHDFQSITWGCSWICWPPPSSENIQAIPEVLVW